VTIQTSYAPRDALGHFLPAVCPECGDKLAFAGGDRYGDDEWHCTGLVDPEDDSKPLAPCMFAIRSYP
jgi:hypothetical protein